MSYLLLVPPFQVAPSHSKRAEALASNGDGAQIHHTAEEVNINKLISEIFELNDELKARLDAMCLYVASARAKNWIGAGDPIYLLFKGRLLVFQGDVDQHRAFDAMKYACSRPSGRFSALLEVMGFPPKDTRMLELLQEVKNRRIDGDAMELEFNAIKTKTEKEEHYADLKIEERLPRRSSVLPTKTTKTFMFKMSDLVSKRIQDTASHIQDRSMFDMGRHKICSSGFISQDLIPETFDAVSKETEYLISKCQGADKRLSFWRKIGYTLIRLARHFAVMITKYHESQLGKDFAEFAVRRFRAIYLLVQSISSLYRGIRLLAMPSWCFLFHKQEFASNADMTDRNLELVAGSYHNFRRKRDINSRLATLSVFLKLGIILAATSQEALSLVLRTGRNYEKCGSLELPISAADLFEDEIDKDFLSNPHQTIHIRDIPAGLEVELADIVPKFKSLGLSKFDLDFTSSDLINGLIGNGSYGVVREVHWKEGDLTIVLKCFKDYPDERRTRKRLVREAQIMMELKHDNILGVFGYTELPQNMQRDSFTNETFCPIALLYPMHQYGSLEDYLKGSMTVTESEKMSFMLDIASALEYLHDPRKKSGVVIHGDLRAANVLINANKQALLCDFGMSARANIGTKWLSQTFQTNAAYLAYEFFDLTLPTQEKERPKLTVKTDIYAFGCVCYEVIHEKHPYQDSEFETGIDIYKRKFLKDPPTIDIPKNYRSRVYLRWLLENCWKVSPERRPSASKLVSILQTLVDSLS